MHNLLNFLKATMTKPQPYGWFHLMFMGIMVVSVVLIVVFSKNLSEKQNRIIIIIYVAVCLTLELYKQLTYSYNFDTREYGWYSFPFQFCSTPMYIALISLFFKKGKVRDSLYAFLSTFGLIAGLAVMIMPTTVFVSQIGINLQTMIHHMGQVLIGAYLLASGFTKLDWKMPLRAVPTFLSLMAIAFTLNVTIGSVDGIRINMFEMGPYFTPSLPVYDVLFGAVPYVVFLLLYVLGFTLGAYLVTAVAWLINNRSKLSFWKNTKKAPTVPNSPDTPKATV